MVEYRKDPRESAFSRFQRQAMGAQKRTQTKSPGYGQIQQNVAKEREKRADVADKRIKSLQESSKENVSKAIDASAWEAPKQEKVTPELASAPKTTTTAAQPGTSTQAGQQTTSSAPTAPGSTEQRYRTQLAQETETRMQESQQAFDDSQKKLQEAEEGLDIDVPVRSIASSN